MCIYVENILAKFHPDLVWNDGALGFFEEAINVSNLYIQKAIDIVSK